MHPHRNLRYLHLPQGKTRGRFWEKWSWMDWEDGNNSWQWPKHALLYSDLLSKEEYKPRKWGAIAKYYASHTKIMLPTRKSVPRSNRQSDHMETYLTMVKRRKLQWYEHVSRSSGLAKTILQGTVKGGRREGRQKKRWSSRSPRGRWRTEKKGGNWLWNHLWCPNNPRG